MSGLLAREFWLGATERAARTLAQALLALWGADAGLNILDVDWTQALSVAAGATVLSVLTSIVAAPIGVRGSPSLVPPSRGRHARPED